MTDQAHAIPIIGATASPYTRKMVALMRFRRIPYQWIIGAQGMIPEGYTAPKVVLLPIFYFADHNGDLQPAIDSTPIAKKLETDYPHRSALPTDPVAALLSDLIEDYADEWLTKIMFHYRWSAAEDTLSIGKYLVHSMRAGMDRTQGAQMASYFEKRQIERLHVVGSNAVTAPVIESCYTRVITLLDTLLGKRAFILGSRPSIADFAVFGQMQQLMAVDPPSTMVGWAQAPALRGWIDLMDDLSGFALTEAHTDGAGWAERFDDLRPLLVEMGQTYAPFIIANGAALMAGEASFQCEINGSPWQQNVQTYGLKCLHNLSAAFNALSPDDREQVLVILDGTGLEAIFQNTWAVKS